MGGSSLATPPLEQAPVGTEPPRRANARITDRSAMTQLGLGTGTDRAVVEKASNTARHLKRGNALRSAPTNTKRIADWTGRRKGLLHGRGTTYGMGRSVLDVPAPDCWGSLPLGNLHARPEGHPLEVRDHVFRASLRLDLREGDPPSRSLRI